MKYEKRILLINFGGIGDQILFFPVLQTLKKTFENSYITFVTEPRSSSAIKLTDNIDELFISNLKSGNKFIEAVKLIKKAIFGRYDMIISSGSSSLVSILLFLTGIKERIGYDSGALSRILLTKAMPLNQNQYAADMYHDLVSAFEKSTEIKIPEISLNLDSDHREYLENLLFDQLSDKKNIIIHPGVSRLSIEKKMIKFWPTDKWVELIKKLLVSEKYRIILTGGPDDREVLQEIKTQLAEFSSNRKFLLDLSGRRFNIEEFAYIVKISDMLVCVDSAPMHIAVGLKKHVAALFGPTDENKLLPSGNRLFTAIKNDKLKCRPCLWDKRQTSCASLNCLEIETDRVFNTLEEKFSIILK